MAFKIFPFGSRTFFVDDPNSIVQLLLLVDPVIHRDGGRPGEYRDVDSAHYSEARLCKHPPEPFCLLPARRRTGGFCYPELLRGPTFLRIHQQPVERGQS